MDPVIQRCDKIHELEKLRKAWEGMIPSVFFALLFILIGFPKEESLSSPEPDPSSMSGPRFTAIASGGFHTCGLHSDGRISCWGNNRMGQLGNSRWTDSSEPVGVDGILTAQTLAAGNDHTCAIVIRRQVVCWEDALNSQREGLGACWPRLEPPSPKP